MKELCVLFVEDSAADADLAAGELERGGFALKRKVMARGRDELRAALADGGWDLVIGEYGMPALSGLDALRMVRELSPDLPFLMLSGTVGEEQAVAAMKAGADDFLVKGRLHRLVPAVTRELRERAERAEREATRKALQLTQFSLDRSSELMLWLREDGGVLIANDTACDALGYGRGEVRDLKYWEIDPGFTPERFRAHWQEVRARGACSMETVLRARSGRSIDAEAACNFVRYAGDEYVLMLIRDIADRRTAEAALRASEEHLRHAQRMEAVGRLAGGIAHDFNNILSVVSGYASLLQMKVARQGVAHKELVEIDKAVVRASSLVRQLLTFSRRQVIQPQVLDLGGVVRETVSMLKLVLGEDVAVETRCDAGAGKVLADRSQMEQVILNLAINARDAMPKGGRLTLEIDPARLAASHFRSGEKAEPGEYVKLSVKDDGQGMDEATMARMFEPFFSTKSDGQGTGLGLATVYGIVQHAGGVIRVASGPGRGTAIDIYLPLTAVEPERGRIVEFPVFAAAPAKGEAILLVEDDQALRKLTKDILVMDGYKVYETRDVDEALGFARSDVEISMMLTDLIMPIMNGRELAAAVLALRPSLRVLYMSGYAPETLEPRAGWLTEQNFLEKPFSPGKLLAKIRALLEAPKAEKTP